MQYAFFAPDGGFLSCGNGWLLILRWGAGLISALLHFELHSFKEKTAAQHFNCTAKLYVIIIFAAGISGKRFLLCIMSLFYLLLFAIFKKRYAAVKTNITDNIPPKIFPEIIGLFSKSIIPRKIISPKMTAAMAYLSHFGIFGLIINRAIKGSINILDVTAVRGRCLSSRQHSLSFRPAWRCRLRTHP